MLIWLTLAGCFSSTPEEATPEPEPAPAEPAPAPAKGRKGKKGKGKKGRKGKGGGGATCPDGIVVNDSWEGEYPDPIADVTKAVDMQGRKAPCQPRTPLACTVPAGLYHPWSTDDHDATYQTVRPVEKYEVLKDTTIGSTDVAAGTQVTVVRYLAEGFCIFDVDGAEIESHCPGVGDDGETFKKLPGPTGDKRQLFQVACAGDGEAKAWIDVADLMKQDGVRPGTMIEFGKVGPGGD